MTVSDENLWLYASTLNIYLNKIPGACLFRKTPNNLEIPKPVSLEK
jgi:hypothetical protein